MIKLENVDDHFTRKNKKITVQYVFIFTYFFLHDNIKCTNLPVSYIKNYISKVIFQHEIICHHI